VEDLAVLLSASTWSVFQCGAGVGVEGVEARFSFFFVFLEWESEDVGVSMSREVERRKEIKE
jgi:hypothetical protein